MNKTRYDDFAAAFREILEAKAPGLGQPDVARLLGTSQPSISRMLKGEQLPSEKVLGVMEELWGIDLGSQVEERDEPVHGARPEEGRRCRQEGG